MPSFDASARCRAPAEEVWKLLYDPHRYPEWWAGMERIDPTPAPIVRYMAALPGTAIPTRIDARRQGACVVISCLLTEIAHEWTLEPAPQGCMVRVRVEIPEPQKGWLDQQQREVQASLLRLAAAAEPAATG